MSTKTSASVAGGGGTYFLAEIVAGDDVVAPPAPSDSDGAVVAGTIYYAPIVVSHDCVADGLIVIHGTIAAQDLFVALYDSLNYAPRNRIAVSVQTVNSGVNRKQLVMFAATVDLTAGLYFCAFCCNGVDRYHIQYVDNALVNPAGIANGLVFYTEVGVFAAPPVIATPVQAGSYLGVRIMKLEVYV